MRLGHDARGGHAFPRQPLCVSQPLRGLGSEMLAGAGCGVLPAMLNAGCFPPATGRSSTHTPVPLCAIWRAQVKKRLVVAPPAYIIKVVTKDGIKEVKTIVSQ